MKLLDEITEKATGSVTGLPDLLRLCLRLARDFKNEALENWAKKELLGYDQFDVIPDYRLMSGSAKGSFKHIKSGILHTRRITDAELEEPHKWLVRVTPIGAPIAAFENSPILKARWPHEIITLFRTDLVPGYALEDAWLEVLRPSLVSALDVVRTRVLFFALDLRKELGSDGPDVEASAIVAAIDRSVNVNIHGDVIGNVQLNVPIVFAGDVESLLTALQSLGLDHSDLDEVQPLLEEERSVNGPKTKRWITSAVAKARETGLKIGTKAAENALTKFLTDYLGSALS